MYKLQKQFKESLNRKKTDKLSLVAENKVNEHNEKRFNVKGDEPVTRDSRSSPKFAGVSKKNGLLISKGKN